jgi:hypothetical protein
VSQPRPAKRLAQPTSRDKVYAAGFFDGEGFITIAAKTVTGARGLYYTMRVGAAQNNPRPLEWLQARWGGSVRAARRKTAAANTTYVWMCFTRQAAAFLSNVLPHLQVKRRRALLALRFQKSVFNPGQGGHTQKHRELLAAFKAELNYLNTHKPAKKADLSETITG